jgi:hypothetical protein
MPTKIGFGAMIVFYPSPGLDAREKFPPLHAGRNLHRNEQRYDAAKRNR